MAILGHIGFFKADILKAVKYLTEIFRSNKDS